MSRKCPAVWIFDPNARRHSKETLKQCYSINENEKKGHYNTRIMEVDQGSFMPLVFTVTEGIGGEGRAFYRWLATLLWLKNGIQKSKLTFWNMIQGKFCTTQKYVVAFERLPTKVSEWKTRHCTRTYKY